jgi:hypothetical protein
MGREGVVKCNIQEKNELQMRMWLDVKCYMQVFVRCRADQNAELHRSRGPGRDPPRNSRGYGRGDGKIFCWMDV